jgi:hypothetical protein
MLPCPFHLVWTAPSNDWVAKQAAKGGAFLELVTALQLWCAQPHDMAAAELDFVRGVRRPGEVPSEGAMRHSLRHSLRHRLPGHRRALASPGPVAPTLSSQYAGPTVAPVGFHMLALKLWAVCTGEIGRAVSFIYDVGMVHLFAPAGTVLFFGRPLDVTRPERWNCTLDTNRCKAPNVKHMGLNASVPPVAPRPQYTAPGAR